MPPLRPTRRAWCRWSTRTSTHRRSCLKIDVELHAPALGAVLVEAGDQSRGEAGLHEALALLQALVRGAQRFNQETKAAHAPPRLRRLQRDGFAFGGDVEGGGVDEGRGGVDVTLNSPTRKKRRVDGALQRAKAEHRAVRSGGLRREHLRRDVEGLGVDVDGGADALQLRPRRPQLRPLLLDRQLRAARVVADGDGDGVIEGQGLCGRDGEDEREREHHRFFSSETTLPSLKVTTRWA